MIFDVLCQPLYLCFISNEVIGSGVSAEVRKGRVKANYGDEEAAVKIYKDCSAILNNMVHTELNVVRCLPAHLNVMRCIGFGWIGDHSFVAQKLMDIDLRKLVLDKASRK